MVDQEQPSDGQEPQNGRDVRRRGTNQVAQKQREQETEVVEHERDQEKWGSLPSYMQSIKTRGGQPEVPERYRKYRDAFLKQSQKGDNK